MLEYLLVNIWGIIMIRFRYYVVNMVHKITGIRRRVVYSEYEDAKCYADRFKKEYHVVIEGIR